MYMYVYLMQIFNCMYVAIKHKHLHNFTAAQTLVKFSKLLPQNTCKYKAKLKSVSKLLNKYMKWQYPIITMSPADNQKLMKFAH